MFKKEIVVDGRAHLLGRLASIVAKQLLEGQAVTVVRCEEICVTGHLAHNRLKFMEYLRKRMNSNPRRGPYHHRAPSMMFFKAVRGMVPRKSARGQAALGRLRVFDGCPHPYDTKKKMVVPQALRVLQLTPSRQFTVLKEIASRVGWNQGEIIGKLEDKRREKAQQWYQTKVDKQTRKEQALEKVQGGELKSVIDTLKAFGH